MRYRKFNNKVLQRDTVLIVVLGLLSFGGGSGRFAIGLGFFDFLMIGMFAFSLFESPSSFLKFRKNDIRVLAIFISIILLGLFRTLFANSGLNYDYVVTELRFFIYFPVLYYLSLNYNLDIKILSKIIPYILFVYIVVWAFFLTPGGWLFSFFNDELIMSIGDQKRISGPPILVFVPLLLLLINNKLLNLLSLILYSILILLVFMKTGGRTYFIFYLIPVFYLMFKRRKNIGILLLSTALILAFFFLLKEFTSTAFFERFLNITNATEDSSFMYRVYNIEEMIGRLKGDILWLGNGIGSNYEVDLFGWKVSFFLDNTFVTLIYKIGILGLLMFILIFFVGKKWMPKDIYYFEIISILIIASISYHIILNPVFIFGYFIILNYYRRTAGEQFHFIEG